MCGVVGILGPTPVNQSIYDALTVVQHRGQDAAGIMTCDGNRVYLRKDNGLVRNVFRTRHMHHLVGHMGIGHCRYPTAGTGSAAEAQPLYVNSPFGIALGHNGNLTNTAQLRESLFAQDLRHLNTNSDSEIILNVLAHELRAVMGRKRELTHEHVFHAMNKVYERCHGAYAVVSMVVDGGILAFRDRYGIRPLVYGVRDTPAGREHMFASESVALDVLGFDLVSDVQPGEAMYVSKSGRLYRQLCAEKPCHCPCIFEHVYLARPDSIIDGVAVHKARMRMGEKLADRILEHWPDHDIDVIIPVPDTSRTSALQMSYEMGVKYREGFIKNRYIGRTFIMPGQAERKRSVRQKLNAIELEFRGKNVLLVDDSIVRGNTSRQIIQMAREAGANRAYFASAAPPVRYPNVYGIDMPDAGELVGHGRSEEEIRIEIGADRLFFQNLEDLLDAAREGNVDIEDFEASCFHGRYITGDVSGEYLDRLQQARHDSQKMEASTVVDLNEVNSYGAS
ncbi:MAG: Amidophosphoribosyltransferase [Gammaproteobacteria bacterium]|nr:Amidophosphoribosyltransferase [Gammaproteobacteria bacterium]